jgi:hypothetical protein
LCAPSLLAVITPISFCWTSQSTAMQGALMDRLEHTIFIRVSFARTVAECVFVGFVCDYFVLLDVAKYDNARCLDGSTGGYYIHPGKQGASCVDKIDCFFATHCLRSL